MSEPLRFKPVNPAHDMVFSADGGWVSYEDYQSLKDTLQCSFNSNRELKAEVKELKSQPDPLTAYLYAAELAKDDIKRLKAEVDLWKLRSDNWQKLVQVTKAEVERLTKAGDAMAIEIINAETTASAWLPKVVRDWNAAKEGKPRA